MKRIILFLLVTLALTIHHPLASSAEPQGNNAGGQPPAELREKVTEFQKLLKEKSDAGMDVSKARDLGRQSREAAQSGDFTGATTLMDQALALLKGTGKTTGTTADTSKTTKPAASASGSAQPAAPAGGQSTTSNKPATSGMGQKVVQFQKLLKEKKDAGMDVSKAAELGRQSREAGMSGDDAKACSLIDQALALLQGSSGATTTGTAKPVK